MRLTQSLRHRASAQDGFTMITVMLMLFVIGALSVAALAAANGDIRLSRYDQDDKAAEAAAEAGIADYFAHLQQDPDYWTRCAGENSAKPLASGNAVNQPFTGTPPAGRRWRDVPNGGTANAEYSIELIPAPGKTSCSVSDPAGSMIDGDGNLRIRATGHIKGTNNYEAVVATFRRTGFLDFLYFTDLENQDPTYLTLNYGNVLSRPTDGNGTVVTGDDLATWAADKCEHHYWGHQADDGQPGGGEGRKEYPQWRGQLSFDNGATYVTPKTYDSRQPPYFLIDTRSTCGEITFASDDVVNGPFHSNDDIAVGGSPDFGRSTKKDRVEVANIDDGTDTGWRGSGAAPNFNTPNGKMTVGAGTLDLPPGNSALKRQALPAYTYTGPTTIVLKGDGTMDVTPSGGSTSNVAVPSNGVIYVKNSSCTYGYKPTDTQTFNSGCGIAKVSGSYNKDLTIAAQDDVVVMNNLQRATGSTAVLGLVADNFVRVWHPTTARDGNGNCTNQSSPTNMKIDAAILSLKHSFTVDNYDCGASLGTLTVTGAIAQKHRGIVGTSGGTGYIKNYVYDDRLKYRSPPYFLDPVQASWRILRQNDQTGAR